MKDDGGPAFPTPESHGDDFEGMSLRDYFAAASLTGYRCAYHQWYVKVGATGAFPEPRQLAEWAYADADAMLKVRLDAAGERDK